MRRELIDAILSDIGVPEELSFVKNGVARIHDEARFAAVNGEVGR